MPRNRQARWLARNEFYRTSHRVIRFRLLVFEKASLAGERMLLDWQARHGGVLTRIAVSHVAPLGMQEAWRPLLPVTQLAATKPR